MRGRALRRSGRWRRGPYLGAVLGAACVLVAAPVRTGWADETGSSPGEAKLEALAGDGVDAFGAEGEDFDVLDPAGEQLDPDGAALGAFDQVLRDLAAFREHPIDLNRATAGELLRLPFVDPATAAKILLLRERLGGFRSVDDLRGADGLGEQLVARLRPYVMVRPAVRSSAKEPRHETARVSDTSWDVRTRVRLKPGDRQAEGLSGLTGETETLTRRAGTYLRLRVAHGELLKSGLACEKDPWERSFGDHTAFFVSWGRRQAAAARSAEGVGAVRLVAGDFTGSWAQGLVLGGGGFASTGGYPLRRDRMKGYDGAGESLARRGAFAVYSRGAARVYLLASKTALDASVGADGLVGSLRTSGLHRTDSEVDGAGVLTESLRGARVAAAIGQRVEIGASVLDFAFDPPFAAGDPTRKRFAFHGAGLTVLGADVRLALGGSLIALEVATGSNGGKAELLAARVGAGNARFRFGLGRLSRDYASPLGRGLPGCSGGSNVTAGWLRAEYRAPRSWRAWAQLGARRRPWRSYHLELPDGGTDASLGAEFRLGGTARLSVEMRASERGDENGEPAASTLRVRTKTRIALTTEGETDTTIFVAKSALSEDEIPCATLSVFGIKIRRELFAGWSATCGATTVLADGTGQTIVQYEPRLPGEFGLETLNGSGTRWYILAQAALPSGAGLSVRLAGGPQRGEFEFGLGIDVRS